eukprot:TRINITY_DN5343_c0_g5_i1.p1 TRINITY_DN5343_c0_g5~~TRINITY_DN5343_c0_g5_i1.p1  ORF type:complete len:174 (+),score=40.97 TRINITY_DN5343_c0_g5_i1:1076-1597(+)
MLLACCKVTLMPGLHDVGSVLLPQRPLAKCLFDSMGNIDKLELVTNPCTFQLNGMTMLGISGMSLLDIMAHSSYSEPIEIMKKQLEWRHICPTAPDTLRTYPFEDADPFVLEESPNIFFAGNQSKFDTATVSQNSIAIRLMCIPSFVRTQQLALLDIETLEVFDLSLAQSDLK